MKANYSREVVEQDMPELPEGYFFKVTRPFLGFQETQLRRKRAFWFSKELAGRTRYAGWLTSAERVVSDMRDIMRIHGGDEALAADMGPKRKRGSLTGKYRKRTALMPPIVARPDYIEYDEATETFTLSEEILERLRNGI